MMIWLMYPFIVEIYTYIYIYYRFLCVLKHIKGHIVYIINPCQLNPTCSHRLGNGRVRLKKGGPKNRIAAPQLIHEPCFKHVADDNLMMVTVYPQDRWFHRQSQHLTYPRAAGGKGCTKFLGRLGQRRWCAGTSQGHSS